MKRVGQLLAATLTGSHSFCLMQSKNVGQSIAARVPYEVNGLRSLFKRPHGHGEGALREEGDGAATRAEFIQIE